MPGSDIERIALGPELDFPLGAIDDGVSDPIHTVAELLPDGYAHYIRVFHPFLPADPRNPDLISPGPSRTWRSLAEEVGAVYHPQITWRSLIDALGGEQAENRPYWVSDGRLDEPARSALFALLARDETRPATYLYYLSGIVRADGPLMYRAPLAYHRQVQAAASEIFGEDPDDAPGPEFVWPIDRAWVVNTDYDLVSTYVACDDALAESILNNVDIEAQPVSRSMRVDDGADQVNTDRPRLDSTSASGDINEH